MWFVYFLLLTNNEIYVGSSNNVAQRLIEHNNKLVVSTAKFLPAKLLSYICVPTKSKAIQLEKYFKSGSGKSILKKRIIDVNFFVKDGLPSEAYAVKA